MIHVRPHELEGTPIVGLVALSSHRALSVIAGETIGYYCLKCSQSDETLEEIIHNEDCPLAGDHGRSCYGKSPVEEGPITHDSRGELQRHTKFTLIKWGWTDTDIGIYNDGVVGVRCDQCHSMDEHLFEIVHDATCGLSLCEHRAQRA